jgi:hypothetical protein
VENPRRSLLRAFPELNVLHARADSGAGSRGGAGCLAKRGRADGMMPEAGPRVAEAGWHQPAEIGPAGHQTSPALHLAGTLDLTWSFGRRTTGRLYFRLCLDGVPRPLHRRPKSYDGFWR